MDERQIEQGYANFHRKLNHILRKKDVKAFKAFIASHPMQAGRLSRCLGLSDELAEIEIHKAMVTRSALKDMHPYALKWLSGQGIEAPIPNRGKRTRKGKKRRPFRKAEKER